MSKSKEYYESLDKRTKEYKEWKQSKGLGDYVEDITKATGLKDIVGDCKGCEERKEKLNKLSKDFVSLFKRVKPNEFTESDLQQWEDFKNREKQHEINHEQQKLIIRLLNDVLKMSVKPCSTCSASVWIKYIKMLDAAYDRQLNS